MTKIVYNFAHHLKESFITDTLTLNISYMKKTLLTAMCLGAAFCMQAQTVLFEDDFEWLAPWSAYTNSEGQKVGDTVGENDPSVYCPYIDTSKIDGVSSLDALREKGYDVLYVQNGTDDSKAGKSCYLQVNYLKFGKSGYQSGIKLPSVTPAAGTTVTVAFDWTKQRQGDGKYDPTQLVVVVVNGENETQFAVPTLDIEDNAPLSWTSTSVTLENATINADTKLIIRPEDSQWRVKSQHRWFIDNIKVTATQSTGIDEIAADAEAPVVYYNLQGVRVANPKGLVIRKQGNTVSKVVVK